MDMITPTNQAPGDLRGDPESDDLSQSRVMSTNERRLERLRAWRAANRERLREYQHNWRADHPSRVRIHREREYAHRRETRLRLRQRRDAQRRRRAIKRAEAMRLYPPYCRHCRRKN